MFLVAASWRRWENCITSNKIVQIMVMIRISLRSLSFRQRVKRKTEAEGIYSNHMSTPGRWAWPAHCCLWGGLAGGLWYHCHSGAAPCEQTRLLAAPECSYPHTTHLQASWTLPSRGEEATMRSNSEVETHLKSIYRMQHARLGLELPMWISH